MSNATETTLLESVPDGLFIGGEWRSATSGATLNVYDPATGEVIKTIADAGVEDGAAGMDAAVDATAAGPRRPLESVPRYCAGRSIWYASDRTRSHC